MLSIVVRFLFTCALTWFCALPAFAEKDASGLRENRSLQDQYDARGGETSGGGGVIVSQLGPVLWDFYGLSYDRSPGEHPQATNSMKQYGFDHIQAVFPRVFAAVEAIVLNRRDESHFSQLMLSIRSVLESYPLIYVETSPPKSAFRVGEKGLQGAGFSKDRHPIQLAAVYQRSRAVFFFAAMVSLDFQSQVGLVIHELIRATQGGDSGLFNDDDLEELTRALTFGQRLPTWVNERLNLLGFTASADAEFKTRVQNELCHASIPTLPKGHKGATIRERIRTICSNTLSPEVFASQILDQLKELSLLVVSPREFGMRISSLWVAGMDLQFSTQVQQTGHFLEKGLNQGAYGQPELSRTLEVCNQSIFAFSCPNLDSIRKLIDGIVRN